MKYLYLRYLNFRLWLLRRRLHRRFRRLGLTKDAPKVDRTVSSHPTDSREVLDYLKIAIGVAGLLSMWLIFFLHQNSPIEVRPSSDERPTLAIPVDSSKTEIISF